jgi:hypothetical protein
MRIPTFQTLIACTVPPLVGVALFMLFSEVFKRNDLFKAPVALVTPSSLTLTPNPSPMRSNAAEVRLSSPVEKVYHPPEQQPMPPPDASALQLPGAAPKEHISTAQKQAAETADTRPAPPVLDGPSVERSISDMPTTWRPILDPISSFWSTLWPRTDALPVIFQAVLLGDAEHVAHLIAMGFSPHEKTLFGDTPVCAAVRSGQAQMLHVLALSGADLNEPGRENQAPILVASLRRNTAVLAALTEMGIDPNTRFKTPVSRELIERCTIKDLRNSLENDRGVTPLICCSARGDVEGAVTLLRSGAKPYLCTTRYHRYPINFAATQGYLFLMRVILGRDPDQEPDTIVTVDLSSQRAWVTKRGKVIATTLVSTGREGYRTPAGRYVITDKHRSHTSTLYHCAMPWFMRLNCSAIGLHSGYVTGRPASHGCIRLPYEKAKQFFSLTDVGDEVEIVY